MNQSTKETGISIIQYVSKAKYKHLGKTRMSYLEGRGGERKEGQIPILRTVHMVEDWSRSSYPA